MKYNCKDLLTAIRNANTNTPDKIACWTDNESINYQQLEYNSDIIAAHIGEYLLKENYTDFHAPLRIGVNMNRTNLLLPTIYAIMKLGCTYVPIASDVPIGRKNFIIQDADLKLVLTDEIVRGYLNATPQTMEHPFYEQPEAYIIYTSGTTGNPKGVVITHESLYHFLMHLGDEDNIRLDSDSVLLLFASINFDVSIKDIFGTLFYGATLVIAEDRDKESVQSIVSILNNKNITYASIPPSILAIMETLDFASLKTLVSGGEAMSANVAELIVGKKPYRFLNVYGPTECTVMCTLNELKSSHDYRNIGKPLPGVVAYVIDNDGNIVDDNCEGELIVGGIQLTSGYINQPELNRQMFFQNPFSETAIEAPILYHTGDIVRKQSDGSFYFIGRRDGQIKLHGHRIELGEINSHISQCPGVTASYVRVEEIASEKHLVAYVVINEDITSLDFIKHQMTTKMPMYMIPSFWNRLDAFPLNANGKIDTSRLVNKAIEGITENSGPLSPVEETIMMVVANVVGLPSINIDEDLIDAVGISSLQLMQIQHDIQIASIDVSVSDFYKYRTIRKLAETHKTVVNYWYNDDDSTTKPVIVITSGFTDFSYMYYKFAEKLSDTFSIYVLESYHSIIGSRDEITAMEMMDIYKELLSDVYKKHHIAAFMGVCLGGEHCMLLAHTLYKDSDYKPAVIVLDGEVERDCDPEKNASLWFPFYSRETNMRRCNIDLMLMRTTPEFHYQGKLAVFLCSVFIDYWSVLDPEMTEKKEYWMKKFWETNPERWKRQYPTADMIMLPACHNDFWLTEPSLSMVCDYIKDLPQSKK